MRPHPGVAFCAPRLRTASARASVLGVSFGWDHLGRRSLAARPPSACRLVLLLELFDDRFRQMLGHLVVLRELLLEGAAALRDRTKVQREAKHLVLRHSGAHLLVAVIGLG